MQRWIKKTLDYDFFHYSCEEGVTDIGLKSEHCFGVAVLGTGEMMARFHWSGTIDVASDWLKRYDSGLLKTAAPSLRNHAGTESNPVDVDRMCLRR